MLVLRVEEVAVRVCGRAKQGSGVADRRQGSLMALALLAPRRGRSTHLQREEESTSRGREKERAAR